MSRRRGPGPDPANAMWGTLASLETSVGSHLLSCRVCTAEADCPGLESLRAQRNAQEDRIRARMNERNRLQTPQLDSILMALRGPGEAAP